MLKRSPGKRLERRPILSFGEFTGKIKFEGKMVPRYNNFWLFWSSGMVGDLMRENEIYQRFSKEHPKLNESLFAKIGQMEKRLEKEKEKENSVTELLKEVEDELYSAYIIMRGYGVSDEKLFR